MLTIITIIAVIFFVLNVVLFFKIWKMTNTVENIFKFILTKSGYKMKEEMEGDWKVNVIFEKEDQIN